MHSHEWKGAMPGRPSDPRVSVCETLTLSVSVFFTLHILMVCPHRHSRFFICCIHFHASVCTGHWEWRRGRGEQVRLKQLLLYAIHLHWPPHTHTLASVPDLTKPSLLRPKVKQMQSSHCYSLNKRVRMNKQRPSGAQNIAEWMRCLERGQEEVTVTMSKPQARLYIQQQVDRWWPETPTFKTFWCCIFIYTNFLTLCLQGFSSSKAVTVFCFISNCLSLLSCSSLHKHTPVHFLLFCLKRSSLSLTGATEVQCWRQQMVAYLTWLGHLLYKIIIAIRWKCKHLII